MSKYGLCYRVSFDRDLAYGFLDDVNDRQAQIHFSIPMVALDVRAKGMNSVQALGATVTYMRRYLWMLMLELIENDTIDATSGNPKNEEVKSKKSEEKLRRKNQRRAKRMEFHSMRWKIIRM